MKQRISAFIKITLIYVLASCVGVGIYLALPFAPWLNLLLADTAATVVVFAFSLLYKNASVYDPYWSVQPVVIVGLACLGRPFSVSWLLPLIAIGVWGIRLTANWAYTFGGMAHQDWRYTYYQGKTGAFYPVVNFFGIHLMPTLVVYACTYPIFDLVLSGAPFAPWAIAFFVVSILAATLQGVADYQMHKFRKSGQGGFIRVGLWKHSRHPNYLGEILMWWGMALFAFVCLPKWYYLVGALANTLLFLFVSIPLADGKQSKKEGFEEYKAQTHALLPIP